MTLPPIKAGTLESVQAYVLRRLVDAGHPMTSEEIAAGCPSHIAPQSISKAASRLYSLAILGRMVKQTGKRGISYDWYVTDLNRIPKDFCWEAHPERSHNTPRPRRKPTTEPSPIAGTVTTQEEPVETASHNPPLLPCGGDPYIPGVTAPAGASSLYHPERANGMPVTEAPVERAPAPAPRLLTPGVYVVYGGKGRVLTAPDARALYAQLKEVFG